MMSNPPSSLHTRQRLHRRQNSTPVAFEAMKVHIPPKSTQRQSLHRRGQSYDMARSPIRRHHHTGSAVSMNTNLGPIQGQQILREAQQQRIARPGQQQIQPRVDTSVSQCGIYQSGQSLPGTPYEMTMNAIMPSPHGMMQHSPYDNIQMPMQASSQSTFMFDENNQHYFQNMHQIQDMSQMMPQHDRRMSQPDLRIQTGMRPYTPTHQIQTAHFPMTPAETPMHQSFMHQSSCLNGLPQSQNQDESILSPRPVSMQKSRSLQGIAEHHELNSFHDVFDAPSFTPNEVSVTSKEPTKSRQPVHIKNNLVTSVKGESASLFGEITEDLPHLEEQRTPVLSTSQLPSSPNRPALSPRRMSISDLHLDPGISASIEETNITLDDIAQFIEGPDPEDNKWICKYEGCDKKFGRKENIKSHVQTHLGDRQFKCDHCGKCFVRGHDLKRHAKIHTGAKAYACLCGNAFARHDALTRHRQRGMCVGAFEGIVRKEIKRGRPRKHRPEMDERVDKASRSRNKRHNQSSSQTSGAELYASSASSCSMSSWGSPPTEIMDNLSIHGGGPQSPAMTYDDTMNLFGFSSQSIENGSQLQMDSMVQIALPPEMFSFTPPASPGYSTGNKPSPSYRELTPADTASFDKAAVNASASAQPSAAFGLRPLQSSPHRSTTSANDLVATARTAVPVTSYDNFDLPSVSGLHQSAAAATQSTSLPSLSHSSSPPPQESGSALVFDFPDDSNLLRMSTMSRMSSLSFGLSKAIESGNHTQTSGDDSQRNEFDSFLDYNDDSQLSLGMNMGMDNSDSFFASL